MKTVKLFFLDVLRSIVSGGRLYGLWMGGLFLVMLIGACAYGVQLHKGLGVTGMTDHVSWGLYISNFTFLVGVAAAALMLVMPAYVLRDVDFQKAVLMGEGVAVAALFMCLAFVVADLGSPAGVWHMIPGVGFFNFPRSMLAWDVIVLNGYLALNLFIPFYLLYCRYTRRPPKKNFYVPLVFLSVFWAVSIHLVTAFLYAGLPARPYWNSSLLGPRFLASAFAAGPAFIICALGVIRARTPYDVGENVIGKLALIATVAAQINLIMLGSELFKEFYWPTAHSQSARYLFFGLDGCRSLVPWIWTAAALNFCATFFLSIHPVRRNGKFLYPLCALLFIGVWMEKGMGLIVPGFVPSPLGEVVEYFPTWVEIAVTMGIWAMGLFVFTALVRPGISIELGALRAPKNKNRGD